MTTQQLLEQAAAHRRCAAALSTAQRAAALEQMARALESAQAGILAANEQDLAAARGSVSDVMLDRLRLTPQRVAAMAAGLRSVAALKCPVGETLAETTLPNGLVLQKRRVPMGVVAIIYESRPNVTADAAALCLQSGNVCVLRGGKEAIRSNTAIGGRPARGACRGRAACGAGGPCAGHHPPKRGRADGRARPGGPFDSPRGQGADSRLCGTGQGALH